MDRCQNCGAKLVDRVAGDLCPACLVQLAQQAGSYRNSKLVPPLTADQLRGRLPGLEIESLIGAGGIGAVYRATQVDLDRLVAVKILPEGLSRDPVFTERFRREARALARLDHPNIVRVYGSGIADGLCYIVMELVEGVTLREAIANRTVDPTAALRIVPQICEALEYAHSTGVIHRDIKPENILLGHGGKVKVADFGLAKLTSGEDASTLLTQTGVTMGTLRYMAPEQFDGETTDARTDIYALGVVFYELLTGRVPMGHFPQPSETPGVDARVDAVVMRTLQREPGRRYQSASEIRTDLFRISKGEPITQAPDGSVPEEMRRRMGESAKQYRKRMVRAGMLPMGREWKSQSTLLGWPIIHIATGFDPKTGRKRIAKGWIAIGDMAIGGIAIGGMSIGLLSVGGLAMGLTSLGGLAIGLQLAVGGAAVGGVALGGAALGGFALGGSAVGLIAIGGSAVGYVVMGSSAAGAHRFNGGGWSDPSFAGTFLGQSLIDARMPYWLAGFVLLSILGPIVLTVLAAVVGRLRLRGKVRENRLPGEIHKSLLVGCFALVGLVVGLIFLVRIPFQISALRHERERALQMQLQAIQAQEQAIKARRMTVEAEQESKALPMAHVEESGTATEAGGRE